MNFFKNTFASLAILGCAAIATTPATAEVYTPAELTFPGLVATPGFLQSWLATGDDAPASQNIGTVEIYLEETVGFVAVDQVGGTDCSGSLCNGNTIVSPFAGNIFAVHIGAGELIYIYDQIISNFSLTVPSGNISEITNGDVACGGGTGVPCGTGLSNIRVFTALDDTPDTPAVPLPGAALLLMSALGGFAALRRFKSKAA